MSLRMGPRYPRGSPHSLWQRRAFAERPEHAWRPASPSRDLNIDVPATDGRRIGVVAPVARCSDRGRHDRSSARCRGAESQPTLSPLFFSRSMSSRGAAVARDGRAGDDPSGHQPGPCRCVRSQARTELFATRKHRTCPGWSSARRLARARGRARAPWNAAAAGQALTRRCITGRIALARANDARAAGAAVTWSYRCAERSRQPD